MHKPSERLLYRHSDVALLRSAAVPGRERPGRWPDLNDAADCRAWLRDMWDRAWLADAVRSASPGLARRLDFLRADDDPVSAKQVRQATMSVIRYALRATGRHTPFGLFAGVAPVAVGTTAKMRWDGIHQAVARVDAQWLSDVVDRLEASPELLDRLDVVFNNLAVPRGSRLETPHGRGRASIRYSRVAEVVRDIAATPVQFGVLIDKLTEAIPRADRDGARRLLMSLVQQGFLITSLRAPLTVTDPLDYVVDCLSGSGADALPAVAPLLRDLVVIRDELDRHNQANTVDTERSTIRARMTDRMQHVSLAGRVPVAVELRLNCDLQLPEHVAREMEHAASALIWFTRQPTGEAVWRDYFTAFCERYGTGTLVPLADVVHPDAGLGFPYGYPGSTMPAPAASGSSERDERLLALAWEAMADGRQEVVLTDDAIDSLTVGDPVAVRTIPPHVELAARIQATSTAALDRGDYTITVAPARSIGTLTGRFTTVTNDSDLAQLYEAVPTAVEGALAVQLSFPPQYPHAENICRVPAFLPLVLSFGEHRGFDELALPLADLAVTATSTPAGLHLVSLSRRRVIEPQILHALALDKQPPPLARFLAHLSRGLCTAWTEFDWGPAARRLPYLPRVRYRRSVLSPAQWQLNADDLPTGKEVSERQWCEGLERWRQRWQCPASVELRDADRSLPIDLTEPAHVAIVRAHLRRYGHAVFTETVGPEELGWIGGHAHDVVLPLSTTRPPAPSPLHTLGTPAPAVTTVLNHDHGQLPGSPGSGWLYAKLYTHPERMDEIVAQHLPDLVDALDGNPDCWFIRYRSLRETDHLRVRIRTGSDEQHQSYVAAIGAWAQQLRIDQVLGRLTFDTYYPEVGRYGNGAAMAAAEDAFVADSRVVVTQSRLLPRKLIHPHALTALNMLGTAEAFLGGLDTAARWLINQPAPTVVIDRTITDDVLDFVRHGMLEEALGWDGDVADAWQARARALATYRSRLPTATNLATNPVTGLDAVLEALLHMHHNRALGVDRDSEATCRRLARQIALAWTAHHRKVQYQ